MQQLRHDSLIRSTVKLEIGDSAQPLYLGLGSPGSWGDGLDPIPQRAEQFHSQLDLIPHFQPGESFPFAGPRPILISRLWMSLALQSFITM